MAFGTHLQQSVHSIGNHLRHGAHRAASGIANTARTIDRVHSRVRPVYETVKPLLRPHINTGMTDEYLRGYDAIRRSVVTAHRLHQQLKG